MSASLDADAFTLGDGCHYTPTLWHTMSLAAWWRLLSTHGFRLQRERWREIAAVTLSSVSNSVLGTVQQAVHGGALRRAPVRYDPIFVLGHWRSGTTFLHGLIGLDERFAFPTSLECHAPHRCLLTERLHPGRLSRWLLGAPAHEAQALDCGSPEEDELALLALGAPSPMWSLAYPGERKGHAYLTLRDVPLGDLERWERMLWRFLRLVSYRHPGKRLVLKSPAHTARLALLARLFPQARFLHIVRDPFVVFSQTVRMWRKSQEGSTLLPSAGFDLEAHVLRTLQEMYQGFESARAALPPGRFHQIYYEQLIRSPRQTLAECYQATGLRDFERVWPRIEPQVANLAGQAFLDEPLPEESRAAVAQAWGPIFRRWGYSL